MAISTISRAALNDDTGDGESGDVLNAAFFGSAVYDKIDDLIAGDLVFGGTLRTGYTADATSYTQANKNLLAGNDAEALGVVGGATLTNINFYLQGIAQRKAAIQIANEGTNGGSVSIFTKTDGDADVSIKATFFADGGFVVGSPTGLDKGAGTINAGALYDDGTLLTDWVFELFYRGETSLPHAGILYPIEETERVAREECRLPWMPRAEQFEQERSHGGMITRLVQGQEQQQLYLFDLVRRVAALEAA